MTDMMERLRRDGGLKWTYHDPDVLPAWVAEMDFGLAPAIADALHDAVDRGLTAYPYPDAEYATAVAAVSYWASRFGWHVDPSSVFPAPDVIEGLVRAITHLTRPGSPVVLHTPVYFPFFGMGERSGRELVEVPSSQDEDGRYTLDLEGIAAALSRGAGSVVLCNPWNPTGRVFTEPELRALLGVATEYDARIIVDEIHSPITYTGHPHTPMASLDPERVITVASASKAWNLPGLKCAQVVLGSEADRKVWNDYFTPEKVGVGTFGLIASTAAYTTGAEWFDDVLGRLESNRDLLATLLGDLLPQARMTPTEGTYLAWIDLSAYAPVDPEGLLLGKARVAVTGGGQFRGDSSSFIRFNFATDPEILTRIVERMAQTLAT